MGDGVENGDSPFPLRATIHVHTPRFGGPVVVARARILFGKTPTRPGRTWPFLDRRRPNAGAQDNSPENNRAPNLAGIS